jgi:hypothetical protein
MQAERDYLRHHVLPVLVKLLCQRRYQVYLFCIQGRRGRVFKFQNWPVQLSLSWFTPSPPNFEI